MKLNEVFSKKEKKNKTKRDKQFVKNVIDRLQGNNNNPETDPFAYDHGGSVSNDRGSIREK